MSFYVEIVRCRRRNRKGNENVYMCELYDPCMQGPGAQGDAEELSDPAGKTACGGHGRIPGRGAESFFCDLGGD